MNHHHRQRGGKGFFVRAIGVARFFSLLDFVLSLSFSFARKTTVLSCLLVARAPRTENREQRTEREREREREREEEEEEDRKLCERRRVDRWGTTNH